MFLLVLPNPNTALLAPAFRRRRRETVVRNMILFLCVLQQTAEVSFYFTKIFSLKYASTTKNRLETFFSVSSKNTPTEHEYNGRE